MALILALKIIQKSDKKEFLIFTDSLSALKALSGRNLNHPRLLEIYRLYTALTSDGKEIVLTWVPGHVGIWGNETADKLARNATLKTPKKISVPFTDFKPKVSSYVKDLEQKEWECQTENKLFETCPQLCDPLPNFCQSRKEESVLCRLHTGHSYLTHSFLLKGRPPPWCEACDCQKTMKHLLAFCKTFSDIRRKHFTVTNFKTLFRDVPPDVILTFVKETGFYNYI